MRKTFLVSITLFIFTCIAQMPLSKNVYASFDVPYFPIPNNPDPSTWNRSIMWKSGYNNGRIILCYYKHTEDPWNTIAWYGSIFTESAYCYSSANNGPWYQYNPDYSDKNIGAPTNDNTNTPYGLYEYLNPNNLVLATNISETYAPPHLSFPLSTTCSGGTICTPYTAQVSSVMDHSISPGALYSRNGIVTAFTGEVGNNQSKCYDKKCAVVGYTKTDISNGEYFFEDNSGNKIINYPGGSAGHNDPYLFYDGHPGYDFPAAQGTDIYAPADGILCVATKATKKPRTLGLWRNITQCPLDRAGSTTWEAYHTFYIIHKGLYINGATNDYMTVFLHSEDLETSVKNTIQQNGYAEVLRDWHIADVGKIGTGGFHMHFEVYKKNAQGNWILVDPYGDGTNNILWE